MTHSLAIILKVVKNAFLSTNYCNLNDAKYVFLIVIYDKKTRLQLDYIDECVHIDHKTSMTVVWVSGGGCSKDWVSVAINS